MTGDEKEIGSKARTAKKQGKRGGRNWRRRGEICETTPDASGNVWNELERKFGTNLTTKQSVETLHATSPQRAETRSNSFHTLQRAAGRLPTRR